MRYIEINPFDTNNGEGIRVSLWLTGCPHKCKGCHNPHLFNPKVGYEFTDETLNQILEIMENPAVDKALSILGGEPLAPYNIDPLTEVCRKVKEKFPTRDIWLWTGYTLEELQGAEILNYIDVLIDGKYEESLHDKSLMWRGSSNQKIHYLSRV